MADEPPPNTVSALTRRGWLMAERALVTASSQRELVSHWFVTPEDDSVHTDEDFGSDQRTLTFLQVVVPTLAERLRASIVAVAVPWNVDSAGGPPLLALVCAMRDRPTQIQARELLKSSGPAPPWWSLRDDLVVVPDELRPIAERLLI